MHPSIHPEEGKNGPVARLINVTKQYQRGDEVVVAVRELSFSINPGEILAVVGPSGCGKSTALGLLAGVDRPDRGEVWVGNTNLTRVDERDVVQLRRRKVGVIFQAFHLIEHLTVRENVSLPLALDGRRDPQRVGDLLARVGLSHRANHFPSELSGGEQQRTAVARALVHRPTLVVADEIS